MKDHYALAWIRSAIESETVDAPDKSQLNGYGDDPHVWQAMEILYTLRKAGSVAETKRVWDERISQTVPKIVAELNRPKRLFHGSELESMPPMKWLVDNQIPEAGIVVIFGQPGVGKSFVALNYAERIAQRKPGIYVMGEGKMGYKARHRAWLKHNKSGEGNLYFYDGAFQVANPVEREIFLTEVRDIKPRFIVLDTFARCFDGEENSARDVGAFIRGCDAIRAELNCTIIIVHHSTKNSTGERGSSALRGAADVMIEITDNEGVLKLSCSKMKDSADFTTEFYKRIDVTLEQGNTSCVLIPSGSVATDKNQLTANQTLIVQWLSSTVFDHGARSTDLQNATGLAKGSFFSAINALGRNGLIRKDGRYDPWMLTPQGIALANKLGITREMKNLPQ